MNPETTAETISRLRAELAAEKSRADAFEQATQGERNIHITTIAERDALAAQVAVLREALKGARWNVPLIVHQVPIDKALATTPKSASAELAELRAWKKYAEGHGLIIGLNKTSDCPEGRLAHTYREGSTLARMFEEWSNSIGLMSISGALAAEAGDFLARTIDRGRVTDDDSEGIAKLRAAIEAVENLIAGGIHSCSDSCQRPLCVLQRKLRAVELALAGIFDPDGPGDCGDRLAAGIQKLRQICEAEGSAKERANERIETLRSAILKVRKSIDGIDGSSTCEGGPDLTPECAILDDAIARLDHDSPQQRLETACILGDLAGVERALTDGANLRANHDRAAWLAREYGHEGLYSELVARGCDDASKA